MRLSSLTLFQASLILILNACGLGQQSQLSGSDPTVDKCSKLVGTCDYYLCVEDERLSCGETGYPVGYGKRYCEILSGIDYPQVTDTHAREVHPADGNVWKEDVRSCLQVEMEKYFSTHKKPSCDELRAFAFGSHPKCYTQTTSFCDLNPASIVAVGLNIAPSDLLSAESQRQVRDTAKICVQHMNDRLANEKGFFLKLDLIKYRTLWQAVALTPSSLTSWMESFVATGDETIEP